MDHDSNGNKVTVHRTLRTVDGIPVAVVRLVDEPLTGYLVAIELGGSMGSEECPSSYGMPCLSWFGSGERFATAEAALDAICDAIQY